MALHTGPANPALEARMLALEARGVAGKDPADPAECARLLLRAERALEEAPAPAVSTWVSHFDEGSLASETTRCLRQLGDLEQARQQAERIISLRVSHRTRSRAFGRLALASVLIAQQEPDQACDIASDVLNATQSLGSYLVISQLIQLRRQLTTAEPSATATSKACSSSTANCAFEFCDEGQAKERLRPYVWRRASAALEALETGRARYLQDGSA